MRKFFLTSKSDVRWILGSRQLSGAVLSISDRILGQWLATLAEVYDEMAESFLTAPCSLRLTRYYTENTVAGRLFSLEVNATITWYYYKIAVVTRIKGILVVISRSL